MSRKPLLALALAAILLALLAACYIYTGRRGQSGEPDTLAEDIARRKSEGYATELAEYYAARARYYAALNRRSDAEEAVREAWEALIKAELAAPVNDTDWPLLDGALGIDREPSAWDFVPLGRVFVKAPGGWLTYPRNDRRWVLSCFIIIAVGETADGKLIAYQGRLPLSASEHPFTPRIYVDGEWRIPRRLVFAGPLYYDAGGRYDGPAVYEHDLTGRFTEYIAYIPSRHLWRHAIVADNGTTLLELVIRGKYTMWISDWKKGLVVHGVYPKANGFDAWGGFWVIGPANLTLRLGGREVRASGYAVFDRASHRSYPSIPKRRGAPVSFTCMAAWAPGFAMAVSQSTNPSPLRPPGPMEHQARIWVNSREYKLSEYKLEDDGGLQPRVFRLYTVGDGRVEVNLTGRVFMYWPPRWLGGEGTWWSSNVAYTWGRAFIRWRGYVIVNGTRVNVDAVGVAEMTRVAQGSAPPSGGCGCWG